MTGSSTRPVRAVIFDVDGTLAETERNGHRWAFNEALRSHGLPYHWSVGEYGRLLRTTGGRRRLAQYFGEQGHDERAADHLAAGSTRPRPRRSSSGSGGRRLDHDRASPAC